MNQMSSNVNFKGNLYVKNVNISKPKLEKVAKIFAEKTKGLSDVYIKGYSINGQKGKFIHVVDIESDLCEMISHSLPTSNFKKIFEKFSPTSLANLFARFSKCQDLKAKLDVIEIELANLRKQLDANAKFTKRNALVNKLKHSIKVLENQKTRLEARYNKLKDTNLPKGFWEEKFGNFIFG